MKTEPNQDWERRLDHELKQLPDLLAPAALFHRVMLAVHQRRTLPWYRRPWTTWPSTLQILSLLLFAALAALVTATAIHPPWLPGWETFTSRLDPYRAAAHTLLAFGATFIEALWLICQALGRPIFIAGLCLVLVAYFSAVAILSACYQLAHQPR